MLSCKCITSGDIYPDMLKEFDRRQEVTLCRKKLGGEFTTVSNPFLDDWTEEKRAFVVWAMGDILSRGGWICGAYREERLVGVIALENTPLGSRGQYREICGFWVSRESRGQGIGRTLFAMAKEKARAIGAEKLYISSHPAVETQAFYAAMGCREAEEYSARHVAQEPDDCQLECSL